MELDFKGKVGVITGASRGIGAAIARQLAQEGCALMLTARGSDGLAALTQESAMQGAHLASHPIDLRDPKSGAALAEATIAKFGRIDFIVANAGAPKIASLLDLTDEDWEDGFALKFFGHMRLIRAAWPQLKASQGSVIIIAGNAGRTPSPDSLLTGTINAALQGFTKALAGRALRDKVQVNAINPGSIRTERMTRRFQETADAQSIPEAEAESRFVAKNAISRIGEPSDIAALVSFVLSRRGSYFNSALIDIDGGKTKTI